VTTSDMRVSAAESIGWEWWQFAEKGGAKFNQFCKTVNTAWQKRMNGVRISRPDDIGDEWKNTPDYDTSLDAVAELTKTLTDTQVLGSDGQYQSEQGKFNVELERIVERDLAGTKQERFYFDIINASAIQRLEAYLITKGLWIVKE
jgi:hypothetical protein